MYEQEHSQLRHWPHHRHYRRHSRSHGLAFRESGAGEEIARQHPLDFHIAEPPAAKRRSRLPEQRHGRQARAAVQPVLLRRRRFGDLRTIDR